MHICTYRWNIHVCIYTHRWNIYIYAYIYIHVYIYIYEIYTDVYIYIYEIYICVYIHIWNIYTYVCIYTYVRVCVCIYEFSLVSSTPTLIPSICNLSGVFFWVENLEPHFPAVALCKCLWTRLLSSRYRCFSENIKLQGKGIMLLSWRYSLSCHSRHLLVKVQMDETYMSKNGNT